MPEVLASCQYCGTPVPGIEVNGFGGKNAPKQPELPAWLETLRSSDRAPSPATGASSYATDFVDKDALPSWMRPDIQENMQSGKFPAVRPASRPAPNTEGNVASSSPMSARSLIDEQSLPSWMQDSQSPQMAQGAQKPPFIGQESIAASSLIQQEAVPEWMKAVQPPSPQSPQTASPYTLPTPPVSQPPSYQAQAAPFAPSALPPRGLAGSDLIDPQALPPWMSGQGQGAPTTSYSGNIGNGGQGQAGQSGMSGMNAGSLIDQSALPSWLREAGQQSRPNAAPAIPPVSPVSPMSPSFPPSPAQPVQPVQAGPAAPVNSISASSFIDVDALPNWLRPADEQPNGSGSSGLQQARPGIPNMPGGPGRVENVRVPSRPRGDMPSIEESAVAANVFASMLGVASAAPNIPGQQPGAQAGFGQQGGMMPPPAPSQQPSQGNGSGSNWNQSGLPEDFQGIQGIQSSNLPPLVPPPGYTIPTPQSLGVAQGPQSSVVGGRSPQQPQQRQTPTGSSQFGAADGQQKNGAKKRGFLETILNWFSR